MKKLLFLLCTVPFIVGAASTDLGESPAIEQAEGFLCEQEKDAQDVLGVLVSNGFVSSKNRAAELGCTQTFAEIYITDRYDCWNGVGQCKRGIATYTLNEARTVYVVIARRSQ